MEGSVPANVATAFFRRWKWFVCVCVYVCVCVCLEDEIQRVESCSGVTERPCGYANTSQGQLLYQK